MIIAYVVRMHLAACGVGGAEGCNREVFVNGLVSPGRLLEKPGPG